MLIFSMIPEIRGEVDSTLYLIPPTEVGQNDLGDLTGGQLEVTSALSTRLIKEMPRSNHSFLICPF
jgi:hypothetical protein